MTEQKVAEVVDCPRCGLTVAAGVEPHDAEHRRRDVVGESAMRSNRAGVDFQPGQRWAYKHGPRQRARIESRRRAAR